MINGLALLTICTLCIGVHDPAGRLLPWSREALSWSCFQERDTGSGNQIAFSYIGIEYDVSEIQGTLYASFIAVFNPNESWVISNAATSELLLHEQRAFDITELYARKMRKDMASYLSTLEDKPESNAFLVKTRKVYQARMNEMLHKIRQYNAETINGRDPKAQKRWNAWIDLELSKLDKFLFTDPKE